MNRSTVFGGLAAFFLAAALVACGGGNEVLENAEVLVDLGKYDKAIEVLDAALMDDPKNVQVHLLKGRVYMGLGEMEDAEDAFTDAVAVGGKSAVRLVDEAVIAEYRKGVERIYPPEDRTERKEFAKVLESLSMLNEDASTEAAMMWTLDYLPNQSEQIPEVYEMVVEAFGESKDLEEETVETAFLSSIEVLLQKAQDDESSERAAQRLSKAIDSEKGEEQLEELAAKYRTDLGAARETMADMRTLATATEAFGVDNAVYPNARSLDGVRSDLEPIYVKEIPMKDGWGTEFLYLAEGNRYLIVSAGADKVFDQGYPNVASAPRSRKTEGYGHDIVYSDGYFLQYPKTIEIR